MVRGCAYLQTFVHLHVKSTRDQQAFIITRQKMAVVNLLLLTEDKSGLTIFGKILELKAKLGRILRRNVNYDATNNSPSNMLGNNSEVIDKNILGPDDNIERKF